MKLKLVLFGRGVGEGVLCNYDSDEWVIVDSCYGKNNSEKKAAALEYLEEHSISFEKVKLIVISHFHDDHIKGMLDIVRGFVE
ncbi:MBL fold metallo-hydrolase [Klebsiella pneumoniae]|nr:MBL fold metallo-hydrolase [Klebsiella pneumoniae]